MHPVNKAFFDGLIDYAGLFPPAGLPMEKAVERFARHIRSEHAWVLAHFICPVSRLGEFVEHARVMLPGTWATSGYREMADDSEPWRISAIVDGDLDACLDTVVAFNEHHSKEDNGLAQIDSIEMRVTSPDEIDRAIEEIPEDIHPYFEFPISGDCRGFVAALAGDEAAAKIRCGGVTPDLIPPSSDIARFLHAARAGGVRFKATAGLHHPIRAEHALTYEADSPKALMHGYLNLFMAAAFVRSGKTELDATEKILEERDPTAFRFSEEGVRYKDLALTPGEVVKAREGFAVGYGSCSFDEPVGDAKKLGLL